MSSPERDRENNPKSDSSKSEKSPDFDAVLPSSPSPSSHPEASHDPAEVFDEIDAYQKKIEKEWSQAKKNYQEKIDQIMDDFLKRNSAPEEKPKHQPKPSQPDKKPGRLEPDPRLEELMEKAKKALERSAKSVERLPVLDRSNEAIINAAWKPVKTKRLPFIGRLWPLLLLAAVCTAGLFYYFHVPSVTPLPYSHAFGLYRDGNKFYVVDWFRQTLYVHEKRRGFPIVSVEAFPNKFVTGFTRRPNGFLSINGMTGEFYEHAQTEDHRVLTTKELSSPNPGGLTFDGRNVWMADNGKKIVFKIHGGDLDEVLDKYRFDRGPISGMTLYEGRLWALNSETREITVYRIENPLRVLAVFDLDPFINGGKPTGISVADRLVWIVTESPSQILKISKKRLHQAPWSHDSPSDASNPSARP